MTNAYSKVNEQLAAEKIVLPQPPEELQRLIDAGGAVVWSQPLRIKTYEPGQPSEYPMYLDHRVYQGSSGKVYPIPFTESIDDDGHEREWQAVHLENEYVRVVVLPELGGRIHIGYDKTTGYDFFYRNNVIKPALVGLAGPWISGGVEFNWPQHHRPATYLPVETQLEQTEDGSAVVWCSDHDPFARMSGQHGIRLRPGSSVIELEVRLHNRTSERQTFLWWANVAALVNDHYQSFFPQDVKTVADHARRALTSFPAADRPYYNVPYADLAEVNPGADRIDFYRNIPVPTSYMIVDSDQDFFGGYDHGVQAGFVHWAERRVSPGKKQWTWGNAPFGHAWDAQLTDEDGPYVELMAGVYTDNQPDFSWIMPGETKTFSQYWYPIPATGPAHQATPDASVNVEQTESLTAKFSVTKARSNAWMKVTHQGRVIAERKVDLRPGEVATIDAEINADLTTHVEMIDSDGSILVRWQMPQLTDEEPWVATEPPMPNEIDSIEELYLTGVHLSQNRHPTRSPLLYWNEALRRDPADVRTNLAIADVEYREGLYESALARVRIALQRLTRRNANPMDAEALYLKGLLERRLGKIDDAVKSFGKAGWDARWASSAGFELAQIYSAKGEIRSALRVLDSVDAVSSVDSRRIALRAILLARGGDGIEANALVAEALKAEPLNALLRELAGLPRPNDVGILLDVAIALRDAGETERAIGLLELVAKSPKSKSGNYGPLAWYLIAAEYEGQNEFSSAILARESAREADLTWAFPYGLDALDALTSAVAADPGDSVALYLLGNLLYAHQRRLEARDCWEASISSGLKNPVLFRNAGLVAYNITHDDSLAWQRYCEAIELAPTDARLHYERDQLAMRIGHSSDERLARLEAVRGLVETRDDLTIEFVGLLISSGRAKEAYEILTHRKFHPWEGGEGRTLAAWDAAHKALGLELTDPPANLGEARPIYNPPVAEKADGGTDYFATSLPKLLLFSRQ